MGKIRILSDNLVSKIAAGEIVERPASVVKELLENSIDAGSANIEIELESGGRRLIRVSDDGEGMTRDESLLSLERHATSKIKDVKDLFSLTTLGFRGEALPSIASVSRFRMTTRTHAGMIGTLVKVDGGVVRGVEEAGAPPGTSIESKDLFFNTPPRLKFMKRPETELSNVIDVVEREAIPRPGVSFFLKHDGRELLRFPARESVLERIRGIYPGTELFPIEAESGGVRVTGYFASPLDSRSTARKLYTYVNGRGVRDRFLTRMVMASYGRLIEGGKYPQGVLFVELSPGEVDVNVHPSKYEVRFRNPSQVSAVIGSSISAMLGNAPWIASYDREGRYAELGHLRAREGASPYSPARGAFTPGAFTSSGASPHFARPAFAHGNESEAESASGIYSDYRQAPDLLGSKGTYSDLNILGQMGGLYIVCASRSGMVLIDQHAAHERINYERIKSGYGQKSGAPVQEMLVPQVLELSPYESDTLGKYLPELSALGLRVEGFGENSFVVRSLPAILAGSDALPLLRDVVGELAETGKEESVSARIERVISTMACHTSVRASEELGYEKMRALLAELDKAEFPHTCPHGRPVARELTYGEIERMFKRT